MSIKENRSKLAELILTKAFKYSETPIFKLASGNTSSYYFNCKPVTLDPEGRLYIGEMSSCILDGVNFEAVGGLTLGADPISMAVSDAFFRHGRHISSFIVRKEPKKHGTEDWIEGDIKEGTPVVITEDVITTGASTIKAIERSRKHGLDVKGVITLIDREEGGKENILKHGVFVKSLFCRSELMEIYKNKHTVS